MKYRTFLLISGIVILSSCFGCGLREGVVQNEPKSYLLFTGNTREAVVYLNDFEPIELDKSSLAASDFDNNHDAQRNVNEIHYQLSPGKYMIVVKKSGQTVVHRTILLGNGITREINIP